MIVTIMIITIITIITSIFLKEGLQLQVSLRWSGDANIAIAIELPAGGEATRMVPKVSDLHVNAIGRVLLAPLVGEIPGFGAAVISLR